MKCREEKDSKEGKGRKRKHKIETIITKINVQVAENFQIASDG